MIPPPPSVSVPVERIPPPPAPSPPPERIRACSIVSAGGRRGARKSGCSHCLQKMDPFLGLCKECYLYFQRLLNSHQWRMYRQQFILEHPLCDMCKVADATDVHHIRGWNFYPSLFWEPSNHQQLCASCHYKHTRSDLTASQRN